MGPPDYAIALNARSLPPGYGFRFDSIRSML